MLTCLYRSIICFEVCTVVFSVVLQDTRLRSKAKVGITWVPYGTTYRSPWSGTSWYSPCVSEEVCGGKHIGNFCLIIFPAKLQSNMTNNFQHSSSSSAVLEVFPKHLDHNSSCRPWLSASAISKFPVYQYNHFPMQSCQISFILPVEFTCFSLWSQEWAGRISEFVWRETLCWVSSSRWIYLDWNIVGTAGWGTF